MSGYLIIVGSSEQQSGPQEIGPQNRVVQKQDRGRRTVQQIGPLWSRLTTNTDTCGIDPGSGSSVKSEYKP